MIFIKSLKIKNLNNTERLLFYKKQIKQLNKKYSNKIKNKNTISKKSFFKHNLLNYIIKITLTKTNIFLNITDIKGNLKVFLSSGSLNLKGRQKTTQPNSIILLLKKLFLNAKFLKNKTIGLQFKNIKPYHELMILNILKNKIFIKYLRSYNCYPHNGCRPKKIKRFKRRTKRLTI